MIFILTGADGRKVRVEADTLEDAIDKAEGGDFQTTGKVAARPEFFIFNGCPATDIYIEEE